MAKRKNVDGDPPTETPPNRPRTRSSGLLSETQPVVSPSKKRPRRKGPPGIPASEFPGVAHAGGSSKENSAVKGLSSPNHTSDDDLNLLSSSPSRAKRLSRPDDPSDDDLDLFGSSPPDETTGRATPPASTSRLSTSSKGTPRKRGQVMEVLITTPKLVPQTPQKVSGFSADSPSPSSRTRNGVGIASSYRNKRQSRQLPQRSPVSNVAHTPSRTQPPTPRTSPSKQSLASKFLPRILPPHFHPYLKSQKSAVLTALQHPPLVVDDDDSAPSSAFNQLNELLNGTIHRNEGNSCLILGPRGCGKSRLVNRVLASLPSTSAASPVVIRLTAHCQTNDRLAMREIARQVQQQVGSDSSLPALPSGEEEPEGSAEVEDARTDVDLPPPSHLPMLISALPALGRPVVVVLDVFDGFAAHARQALLYCLLDTVQSCRGGAPTVPAEHEAVDSPTDCEGRGENVPPEDERRPEPKASREVVKEEHGLLVIGVTSRVDCITLLEKRVKSRFSHRVIRVKTPTGLEDYLRLAREVLCVDTSGQGEVDEEWMTLWTTSVEKFLAEKDVYNAFKETFAFVKELRVLYRLLVSPVIALSPSSPWLTATQLLSSVSIQRCPKRFPFLSSLPYPQMALLIAATHKLTSGHDTFNFEMLYDTFTTQVRMSAAAPVQIAGGAVGMMNVSRGVMMGAFEHLVVTRVFQPVAAPASHIMREFVRYRCVAERDEIKAAVEHLGQTNLKKWFYKAQ